MKEYKVYENNAGGLLLVTFDETGKVDYFHTGYEYNHGQLKEDLEALKKGADPKNDWDGNEINELGEDFEQQDDWNLVADNEGVYLDHAGYAAVTELN